MAIHSTLTGSDLHEPKGIDTATSGTVYIADGNGSGDYEQAVRLSDTTQDFDQMIIQQNTISMALPAGDIDNNSDYIKWDIAWEQGLFSGNDVVFQGDKLTCVTTGIYAMDFWASIETTSGGSGNHLYAIKMSINDDVSGITDRRVLVQSDFSGDIRNVAIAGGRIQLTAGDSISLWMASVDSGTFSIREAGATLTRQHV